MAPEPTKEAVAAPAKAEPPAELEKDAKKDTNPKVAKEVTFLTPDTTMNVLPSSIGNMLVSLSEGGLSQLVAGARANVGVKSGRYMFEAKIVETSGKPQVRVGFSAQGSLYLGEDENSICFEADGNCISHKKKLGGGCSFQQGMVVAVVLNLDASSPNKNTISFFKNGKRACQPVPLPEDLVGKTLFPAVSFKNAKLHLNFAAPAVPLPFKCNSVQDATTKDGVLTKYAAPEGGKYTALFPVSLPDEGSFDWLDSFLEKNPDYTEISDRAFADWAIKSGLHSNGAKKSNDKPDQVALDGMAGVKRLLMEIASMQPRNFVIMEVKGNLIKEERAAALAKFKSSGVFKTVAEVIASTPPSSFQNIVKAKTTKAKQDIADREAKVEHVKEVREWKVRKNTKQAEIAKKKKEKQLKKNAAKVAKTREAAIKKAKHAAAVKAAKAKGEPEPAEEEEAAEEEEPESADEAESEGEPEPTETPAAKVTLTAEEKALKFAAHAVADLTPSALALSFTKFSFPADDEFDTVKYSWAKEKEAAAYLKNWILEKKLVTRVEDISPSAGFKQKSQQWSSTLQQWKTKQADYRSMVAKKLAAKNAKMAAKIAAEKKAKALAEAKAKAAADGKEEEKKAEEPAPAAVEEEEEEPEAEIDFEGIDVFGTKDILDIGGSVPLFKDFQNDDFTLMALRVELHLLVHAFSKDCNDPDRTGMHLDHVGFYYQKYFGKPLTFSSYGVQKPAELIELVKDSIHVTKQNCIESLIPAELESNAVFAKITEEARRQRHLLIDMGDESAKLKLNVVGGQQQGQKRSWDEGGDKKWDNNKKWGNKW